MVNLAITLVASRRRYDRAISLVERAQCRGSREFTHVVVLARARENVTSALFDLMRGDHARATPRAFELARLAREQRADHSGGAFGVFLEGWATAARGALGSGLEDMRRGCRRCCANRTFCCSMGY